MLFHIFLTYNYKMSEQDAIKRFCDQCRRLKLIYDYYYELYETNEMRLKLLEEVAHNFFYDLQGILMEFIFLNICKLTDPARSRKDNNLTIKYILDEIDDGVRRNLELDALSEKLHEFRSYIKLARHKVITHGDLNTIASGKKLGAFPEGADKEFWKNLQEFVNRLYKYYFDTIYPLDTANLSGADDLVAALKKAIHYDDYFEDKPAQKLDERKLMRYKDA